MESAGSDDGRKWTYLRVLFTSNPDFNSHKAMKAAIGLSPGDEVLIDLDSAALPIVRDYTGAAIGTITRTAQEQFRRKVGKPLPSIAVFDRTLMSGCLLRIEATVVEGMSSSFIDPSYSGAVEPKRRRKRKTRSNAKP